MPSRSSWRRTSAKCVAHPSHRWSVIRGRVSIVAWSSGTLQSRTRSGFVSARLWQSAHIEGATSRSAWRSLST